MDESAQALDDAFSFGDSSLEELAGETLPHASNTLDQRSHTSNADADTARQLRQREGEVAMLRQRLAELEAAQHDAAQRHVARIDAIEAERTALVAHLQADVARLSTELAFARHEHAPSAAIPPIRDARFADFADFDSSVAHKRKRNEKAGPDSTPAPPPRLDACVLEALGIADTAWAAMDATDPDRDAANAVRSRVLALLAATGDALLALDAVFAHVASIPRLVLPAYVLSVIEALVCSHRFAAREVYLRCSLPGQRYAASSVRLANAANYASHDPQAFLPGSSGVPGSENDRQQKGNPKRMTKSTSPLPDGNSYPHVVNEDGRCRILGTLLYVLEKIPAGSATSVARRCLVISRAVLSIHAESGVEVPPETAALLSSPALHRHVIVRAVRLPITEEQIVIDALRLAVLGASAAPAAVTAHVSEPEECSTLGLLNRVLVQRLGVLEEKNRPLSRTTRLLFAGLFSVVRKRVLPASVVLDAGTVRAAARRLTDAALCLADANALPDAQCVEDVRAMLVLVHHVAVVEGAPLALVLGREAIGLAYAVRRLSSCPSFVGDALSALRALVDASLLPSLRAGTHLAQAIPPATLRERALSPEEEMELYRRMGAVQ